MLSTSEVSSPLSYDHDVHIAEEHEEKDDLRYELEVEVELALEESCVKSFHANTKSHLENTEYD